jgi:hypothetical protein
MTSAAFPFFPALTAGGTKYTAQQQSHREFTVGLVPATFTNFYGNFLDTPLATVKGITWMVMFPGGSNVQHVATSYVGQTGDKAAPTSQFSLATPLTLSQAGMYTLMASAPAGAGLDLQVSSGSGNVQFLWATLGSNPAGLSDGAIAGIVIGSVAGAALVAGGAVLMARIMARRR